MEQLKLRADSSEGHESEQLVPKASRGEVQKPLLALVKDPRAAAAIAAIAGFLVGLLVFYKPWRLQPDLGDLPTWLAAFFAAGAALVALSQLLALQDQVKQEADRNSRRDKLLDTQLAEAEARSTAARRGQAEGVVAELRRTSEGSGQLWVSNDSPRPVTDVACRAINKGSGQTVSEPTYGDLAIRLNDGKMLAPASMGQGIRIAAVAPSRKGFFFLPHLATDKDVIVVVWFTDDAGFRWQLDAIQHLASTEGDEYKP